MNQNVLPAVAAVMESVRASGLLVSLCTIKVPPASTTFDSQGAIDPAIEWEPLAGHIDIPCTAPPIQTGDNVSATEIKAQQAITAKTMMHVLLDNYYSALQDANNVGQSYRAEIDGIEYEIANVEHDSQFQMTRLALALVTV